MPSKIPKLSKSDMEQLNTWVERISIYMCQAWIDYYKNHHSKHTLYSLKALELLELKVKKDKLTSLLDK